MEPFIKPLASKGNDNEVQKVIDLLTSKDGKCLSIFRTLAHHPELLKDYLGFGSRMLIKSSLPPRQRELLILKTAYFCNCDYEWVQHVEIAKKIGLSEGEINSIKNTGNFEDQDEVLSLLLLVADELLKTDSVSRKKLEELANHFSSQQIIEILFLVGHYRMLAGFLNAVGVRVIDDTT
jgi:4-carboxymuconolactone decarboxylase